MSERPARKKKLRGFPGIIKNNLEPLNTNEFFKKKHAETSVKIMLNAFDAKAAAIVTIDKATIKVEGVPNTPREGLKKKVLGWNGKIETTLQIFMDIVIGKLKLGGMAKKVLSRKIKVRGIRKLLVVLDCFNILSYESKKAEEAKKVAEAKEVKA